MLEFQPEVAVLQSKGGALRYGPNASAQGHGMGYGKTNFKSNVKQKCVHCKVYFLLFLFFIFAAPTPPPSFIFIFTQFVLKGSSQRCLFPCYYLKYAFPYSKYELHSKTKCFMLTE